MQETGSKSISKEVGGLFDKIREQALQYSHLMEELEQLARNTALQSDQMQRGFEQLREANHDTLRRVEHTAQEIFTTINHKATTLNELYEELSSIEQTRQALQELNSVLQTQKREIEKIIKTSETHFKRIADESYLGFENKVAFQFQQIKDEIHVLDKKLLGLLDLHRREMREVQEDIDQFKNKVTETKYIVDETTKIIDAMIEDAEGRIDSKILHAHATVRQQLSQMEQTMLDANLDKGSMGMPEVLGRHEVEQLRTRMRGLEKSVGSLRSISIGLAITALILALIALVL